MLRRLLNPRGLTPRRRGSYALRGASKRLAVETLEPRWLLAQVSLVQHEFRQDDFSISGGFTYELRSPADFDYIDQINNGQYASTAGHVGWTSPTLGTGFFQGQATGDGHDTVVFGGLRRGCSDYGIEDIGRFDFAIDANQAKLQITSSDATSTRYTYYRDLTGGFCPQPDPPWSRFFGGLSSLYVGSFQTGDHTAAISYSQGGSDPMTVNSPATTVRWTDSAATDLTLQASTFYPPPVIPEEWITLEQTAPVKPVSFLDVEAGGVSLSAGVQGQPMLTNTPNVPIAQVRMFWAASPFDVGGAEIPLTAKPSPVGLYWNSSRLNADIEGLPLPPVGATHVRVVVEAPTSVNSRADNDSVYLPLGTFEARNTTTGPVSPWQRFDGSTASLLDPLDAADSDLRVLAYNPTSQLGGWLEVLDDRGGYYFDPPQSPDVIALARGEILADKVEFLAIRNQQVVDQATHTFSIVGENDPPVAGTDHADTTNGNTRLLPTADLLTNDSDPDHGDHVSFHSTADFSAYGAAVQVVRNGLTGKVESVLYDPSTSSFLQAMQPGDQLVDVIDYSIVDDSGEVSDGYVEVTVTGVELTITVAPIATQLTRPDTLTAPIPIQISDPDGNADDILVTAEADNAVLVPAPLQVDGQGALRTLAVMPATGISGKTRITLTATDGLTRVTQAVFLLIVGTADDLDLDGVSDAEEDAAPHDGDMNQDGVSDSRQPHVASARSARGGEYFQLIADPTESFERVAVRDGSTDPPTPAGASFPLGIVHFELMLEQSQTDVVVGFRTNWVSPPINRYWHLPATGAWTSGMDGNSPGARVYWDHMDLTLVDGGRLDDGTLGDATIVGEAGFANAAHPWQGETPLDVDNDGWIVPLDVLIVVSEINAHGPRALPSLPTPDLAIPFFYDVTGDNFITPLDVLTLVDYINHGPPVAAGEGESGSMTVTSVEGAADLSAPPAHAPRTAPPPTTDWWGVDSEQAAVPWTVGRMVNDAETDAFGNDRLVPSHQDGKHLARLATDLLDIDTILTDIAGDIARGWNSMHGFPAVTHQAKT